MTRIGHPLAWATLWAVLAVGSLAVRPLLPIDETRYVSAAWEMWVRGDFLVPHLNGLPYSHKPPLLFWLMQAGWWVFGVNDWWPRLVAPLFALASLFLTQRLARRLWPDRPRLAETAPWILLGSVLWTLFTTATMFDMLVVFFTLLGLLGFVRAASDDSPFGFALSGLALGLGVLAKGPVILLHTLPVALLAPWWAEETRPWGRWYRGIAAALGLAAVIALAWAIPAAVHGGSPYAEAIFWGQTADRLVDSFAHQRPLWWYLPLLPLILFPWPFVPALWRGAAALWRGPRDSGVRLCLAWSVPVLVALSLVSGKQLHYLLPLFPAFALLGARALEGASLPDGLWDRLPVAGAIAAVGVAILVVPGHAGHTPWLAELPPQAGIAVIALALGLAVVRRWTVPLLATTSVVMVCAVMVAVMSVARPYYDLTALARRLNQWQAQGLPIAHVGQYYGQFQFLGRLQRPLEIIRPHQVDQWLASHPRGKVITYSSDAGAPSDALYAQPYRGRTRLMVLGSPVSHPTQTSSGEAPPS